MRNITKSFTIIVALLAPCLANAAELKIGIFKTVESNEGKGGNFNLEYISDLDMLRGNPHLGATANFNGNTSAIYSGLVWQRSYESNIYLQATFGGAVHNGTLKKQDIKASNRKARLYGSRILFRESFEIGYKIANEHKISIMIDHMSNANLAMPNHGLTNYGIRYGIAL